MFLWNFKQGIVQIVVIQFSFIRSLIFNDYNNYYFDSPWQAPFRTLKEKRSLPFYYSLYHSHQDKVIIFFSNHIIFDADKRESKGHTTPNTNTTHTHIYTQTAENWILNAFHWIAVIKSSYINSSSNSQSLKIYLCFLPIIINLSKSLRFSFRFAYLNGFVFIIRLWNINVIRIIKQKISIELSIFICSKDDYITYASAYVFDLHNHLNSGYKWKIFTFSEVE